MARARVSAVAIVVSGVAALAVRESEEHVGVARLIERTPTRKVVTGELPADVIDREPQRRVPIDDGPLERGDGLGTSAVGEDLNKQR